jgi:protein-S-isoprenylcysteine O-methyltransferase Ste14
MASQMDALNDTQVEFKKALVKRFIQLFITLALIIAILFGASGKLDWVWGWIYVASYLVIVVFNAAILLPRHSELIAERGRMKKDAKSWDKIITIPLAILSLGVWAIAGLDIRFGWTGGIPLAVQIIAFIMYVLGNLMVTWAMVSNKYFSTVVRIQEERGHTVANSGPYQFVRHPGYMGMIFSWLFTALALGSWWALIPGILLVSTYVLRTALEDRTLQAELAGYKEYAERVRYRLLPGIW